MENDGNQLWADFWVAMNHNTIDFHKDKPYHVF